MKDITLKSCIEFQKIFYHDGIYSPYETVENPTTYFPLTIIGEIGTFLNNYCKQVRSPNDYTKEVENDCADMFICLLIFGMVLEKFEKVSPLTLINQEWNREPKEISNESEFIKEISSLLSNVCKFFDDNRKYYTQEFFLEIFESIRNLSFYATHKTWQQIINNFHLFTIDKFTQFDRYTPDLWYRGSCYVNFGKLLEWINDNEVELPPKRILFLQRMDKIR